MSKSFADIKNYVLVVLYDYMLTSDAETFWFGISAIREGLPPDISGAFVRRALDALTSDKDVEQGVGDPPEIAIFALTEQGIETAESIIEERGIVLSSYSPSPEVDRIISRLDDSELHKKISDGLAEVAREIRESNELGLELGDIKDLVSSEMDAAASISAKPQFRVARLAALIVPTLRYLADKFIGQGIGELAKQLADLLMKIH